MILNEVIQLHTSPLAGSGIIAILRRIPIEKLTDVAQALLSGGICTLECTFDPADPDCEQTLARSLDALFRFEGQLTYGAGTVLSPRQVQIAADHGAKLIVSPGTDCAVIERTRALGLWSIPGAATPTEALTAHQAGAHFVKLFPAGALGAPYLKALTAPLAHIPFLAVGGIDRHNIATFQAAGAAGFGVGSVLTPKSAIDSGDFDQITQHAAQLIRALARKED